MPYPNSTHKILLTKNKYARGPAPCRRMEFCTKATRKDRGTGPHIRLSHCSRVKSQGSSCATQGSILRSQVSGVNLPFSRLNPQGSSQAQVSRFKSSDPLLTKRLKHPSHFKPSRLSEVGSVELYLLLIRMLAQIGGLKYLTSGSCDCLLKRLCLEVCQTCACREHSRKLRSDVMSPFRSKPHH